IPVILVGSAAGDHGHLPAGVASVFGGAVAGHETEFGEHVGIDAEGGGVGAALAGVVDVDAVEGVVPRPVASAVHVDAATGIGAVHNAGLRIDEVQGIAAARGDDRQIHHLCRRDEVSVVTGAAGLHHFGGRRYFHGLGELPDFEFGVDGGGLADGDLIACGD